ncbi:cupin domain-containing protein [Burkholderia stagnalis]|uniref:cupin domain-containing protein n=1 Tax=Burkholderia stagnalis TaxID=1503054 RepID=UPI00075DE7CF|nr:cupin domain-containing protein [Burkholderia stagnalis]KWI26317.1 hypothetical protein WT71_19865 [Burkholderia stagnalis]KWI71353.1 hypothetical protein WT73_00845 [Burkholderia stagnalis]MDY7807234.1 hypothetical protein [Burkholderia stagnalis]
MSLLNEASSTHQSEVVVVSREDIRHITDIEIDGKRHRLGEHRDFRRHSVLRDFLPESGRCSLSWVRLHDGEVLDNHEHPVSSMILVCSGSVYLTGEVNKLLSEGDVACVPAGCIHGFRTDKGQSFDGLSIQFDGNGLYENESAPRVNFIESDSHFGDLEQLNASLLARHSCNVLFRLLASDQLQEDCGKRKRFIGALYVWAVSFQRMIHARQALCSEPTLRPIYLAHLREELGHDDLLKSQHGPFDDLYDPILEAASQWFVNMMLHGTEAEKIVVVHMVVESSGCLFGQASRAIFCSRHDEDQSYFGIHADADDAHQYIGRSYLKRLPLASFPGLMDVCRRAWDQMDLIHERIALIALDDA